MIVAAVSFAIMAALIKVACTRLPPLQVVCFRGVVGFLLIVALERLRFGALRPGRDRPRLLLRALCGFGGLATYAWSIAHVDLGVASALNQSSPVFVALLSIPLLRERPSPLLLMLIAAACVGAWLVVAPDLTQVDAGALVGLASAVLSALAYILVRSMRTSENTWVIVRWFSGLSALFAVPFAFVTPWLMPQGLEWLALAGVGALGLFGQLAMTHAYQLEQASIVSPFLFLSVVVSLTLGWLFWDEWPALCTLGGVAVVVLASLAIAWRARVGVSAPPSALPEDARAP